MGNDSNFEREDSPDWLRTFQTPLQNFKTISSSSPSSSDDTGLRKPYRPTAHGDGGFNFDQDDDVKEEIDSKGSVEKRRKDRVSTVVNLDSDTGEDDDADGSRRLKPAKGKSTSSKTKQVKQATVVKQEGVDLKDEDSLKVEGATLPEEDAAGAQERRIKRVVSSLPLVFGDKTHKSKVLLECEGDALDVSGDVGAVGRISLSANHENDFLLDLKGVIYKATIVPSNTFLVVNVGQSEAKVEAIMNDFVQLQPCANIFETETMVEGTLEGFQFDSDDEREYLPAALGGGNANTHDENKDEKKQAKQKAKSNKPFKSVKGSIKKGGKSKSTKSSGKGAGSRKLTKKNTSQKRAGK
ncbi:hypothetical protein KP509_21G063000 [Ceratopteris richardii]|nr:hypothetical protein KP509_21G063000 [Ceratopteris richardii]